MGVLVVQFLVGSQVSALAKAQVHEYLTPLRERYPEHICSPTG